MNPLSRRSALLGLIASTAAVAQRHPDYRQALSDLRMARFLLTRPGSYRTQDEQRRAVDRINRAIRDIEQAAVSAHQNPAWREPTDVPPVRADRFRRARIAVQSALRDIQTWEANPNASAWRGRAVRDLNDALREIDDAIQERRGGPPPR
jgi:hypothetical protein